VIVSAVLVVLASGAARAWTIVFSRVALSILVAMVFERDEAVKSTAARAVVKHMAESSW
jgi:hypothetical protein